MLVFVCSQFSQRGPALVFCIFFFFPFLVLGKENSMLHAIYTTSCCSIDLLCMWFNAFDLMYVMLSLCIEVCATNCKLYQ